MNTPKRLVRIVQLLLGLVIVPAAQTTSRAATGVVVTVDGQSISVASSTANQAQLEMEIARAITSAILNRAIRDAEISIPNVVLSACLDAYFEAGGVTVTTAEMVKSKSEALVAALRKVVNGEDSQVVYRENLADVTTPAEWEVWVKNYSSQDQVQKLERLIPKSVEDMKLKSSRTLNKDLETWLLFRKIAGSVWENSADLGQPPGSQPSQAGPVAPSVKQVFTKTYTGDAAKLLEKWWLELVARSSIGIPDAYEGALTRVRRLPVVELPQPVIVVLETMVPQD